MVPRGEVGLVVAAMGLDLGVIDRDGYAVVVAMVALTTVVTPPLLRRVLALAPPADAREERKPSPRPAT